MDNELKSKKSKVYELKYEDKNLGKGVLIKKNIGADDIKKLISYIQNRYNDILPQGMLTSWELEEILAKCYGIQSNSVGGAEENINSYWNTKEIIMSNYKKYEARGLAGELRKIADLEIEQWRCR